MKKITLILFMMFTSFMGYSQLHEDFEGTSLPNNTTGVWSMATTTGQGLGAWRIADNGIGTAQSWGVNTIPANVYAGTRSAYLNREGVTAGALAEDRLITPSITIPTNGQLRFWTRQTLAGINGSTYSIQISTTSQTAGFTTLQTWDEDQLNVTYNVYEEKIVAIPAAYWTSNLPPGTNVYIAFVMTNNNGDRWLIDNVNVVEQCLDPTTQTATNPTLTGATLGWDNPSGASSWEVEIVATGVTPTGTGTVVASNPYTPTNLTQGTCYDFYVRALCTTGAKSEWIGPFNFCTVSLGATCGAPIQIPSLATGPYITTNNTNGFGDDYSGSPGASGCGTTQPYLNGDDVFYSFTATSTNTVTITSLTTTGWSGLFVYNSCTNVGVSCVAGSTGGNGTNTPDSVTFTQVLGETYYVVISTFGSGATQSTPYTLTIKENTCTNMAATFAVASNCASTTDPNTFFVNANVTNMGSATAIAGTSTPASPTTVPNITAAGVMQFGPFPNGTNVTVNLQNANDPNCFRNSPSLTQAFCPATNNLCSGAIPITCTGGTITQTTVGATTAGAPTGTCGTTAGSGGLWYSFAGNGDVVTFSLCGSSYDTKIQVVTGACGAFTCVTGNDDFAGCGLQSQVQVTTAVGTLYYVYVYGFGTAQGVFTLNTTCVTPPPPPVNDNCTTATTVPVNTDGTCTQLAAGTVIGATPSSQANACVGTADDDVWFSFTATQAVHIINIQDIAGSTLDLNHAVYTSTNATNPCGNLTQIICSDPNFSYLTGLVAGQVYYIRVYTAVATPLQTTTFNVCVSVPPLPPINDSCATPTVATVSPGSTCSNLTPGTITSATASPEANACGGTDDDDVWFQFTATTTTHIISLLNIVGTTTALNFVVYSGSNCGALTQLLCNTTGTGSVSNLTIGQTYKVRVYSSTATVGQFTNFNICIGSPSLSIVTSNYTAQQLVKDVLISSQCAIINNITFKTSTTNINDPNSGIAYFQENAPGTLPFPNGVILSTGFAKNATGVTTGTILNDGTTAWTGDAQLLSYMQGLGFNVNSYNNASVLEFDFLPLQTNFSFDFMFASDEYGTFQCDFSDAFAFFLTNTVTGQTTNLAVISGTTTPVAVTTIRDNLYNAGCASVNPALFDVYNGTPNSPNDPTNFNGQTVMLTAQANVIPNTQYHMKLVVADRNDSAYDSAVFLNANSFNVGDIDLGQDLLASQGNAICNGDSFQINSGLDPSLYTISWSNSAGVIPGETGPNLVINDLDVYTITAAVNGSTCVITDSVNIEFYPEIAIATPDNLIACNSTGFGTFDLTQNATQILNGLNPATYTITYYTSLSDAQAETSPITTVTSFNNTIQNQQTIYVRVKNNITNCHKIVFYDLVVSDLPTYTLTSDFNICAGVTGNIEVTPTNFTDADVVYSWTLNANPLPNTTGTINATQAGTYTVTVNNSGCITSMSCTVTALSTPDATATPSTSSICSASATNISLSSSLSGTTYSWTVVQTGVSGAVSGSGSSIADVLTTTGNTNGTAVYTITPSNNGCVGTSIDVTVTVLALPATATIATNSPICSGTTAQFTITGTAGATVTYSINGAASQTVVLDAAGTAPVNQANATANTTLEISNIMVGSCSNTNPTSATVTVIALPSVLSVTANGPICSGSNAQFTIMGTAGATVTYSLNSGATQTVVLTSGTATVNQANATSNVTLNLASINSNGCNVVLGNIYTVNVVAKPVAQIVANVSVCKGSSYALPTLNAGNAYYTNSNGTGTPLTGSIVINATQTVYVYAAGTLANCSDVSSFVITAVDLPVVMLTGGCSNNVYTINATVSPVGSATYAWTGPSGSLAGQTGSSITASQDGQYTCVATVTTGGSTCTSTATVFAANGTLCTIQKGISPNGDGLNDSFDLTGLNVKKLEIFNRYGKKVYSYSNYVNQWYGQSDKGDELPVGTYYFVIERDNVNTESGWIYINR